VPLPKFCLKQAGPGSPLQNISTLPPVQGGSLPKILVYSVLCNTLSLSAPIGC
jgi:hypothetical protein